MKEGDKRGEGETRVRRMRGVRGAGRRGEEGRRGGEEGSEEESASVKGHKEVLLYVIVTGT